MRPLSPFQKAQQKLEADLQEFHQVCATDQQFEAEVKKLVDIVQPYHYSPGYGVSSTQLKSSIKETR